MNTIPIILCLAIICAILHKNKGYSPIAGFLLGFFLPIIGLIIVLLEQNREERDMQIANNNWKSFIQWLLIFFCIGIFLIIIIFIFMNLY